MIKFEKKKIKIESLQRTCCVRLFLILGTLLESYKMSFKTFNFTPHCCNENN